MKPRLHYRFLFWNLILFGLVILTIDIILNTSLRFYLRQQIERQLHSETELVSSFLTPVPDMEASDRAADRFSKMLGVRITVIDDGGRVLGDSELDGQALRDVENHAGRPEVRQALEAGVGTSIRYSATTHVHYMYFARKTEGGYVRLAMTLARVDSLVSQLRSRLLYASLLAVALTLLFSYFVALRFSRPIREIALAANRLAGGDLSLRIRTRGNDEIAALGSVFNTMAANLSSKIQELSEGKQRLEQILGAMGEGVMVLDSSGTIQLTNRSVLKDLGVKADILGRKAVDVLDEPGFHGAVTSVMEQRKLEVVEFTSHAGRVLEAHLAPVGTSPDRLEAIVIVFHDLTEIRRTEQMRKDFVTNVSHEFKTPLTSIRGYTETLLSGAGEDGELRNDFLRVIERNAKHLESLVQDLLILAKLEAELPESRESVDVRSVIAEHLSLRETTLNGRDIEVTVDCPSVSLITDRPRLAAAISNLIDNAINHNRPGGKIRISGRLENGAFTLDVEDSGYGIPKQDLPRIFERFYRVDKARSRYSGGTGLGLAIAKHAVESQGGRITVESTLGEGSKFTIRLSAN